MFEFLKNLFPDKVIKEEDLENYKRARGLYIADPWERVKCIFRLDSYYNLHPELLRASSLFQVAFVIGGGFGGVIESVKYSKNYTRTNDLKLYLSRKHMYRELANKSMVGMGRGIIKWGPKIGLFAGGFSLLSSCCEAYRNKAGVIEYVIGGYFVGGFTKSAFGIKGFIAGGIVGALLGLTYGTLKVIYLKLTKTDELVFKYSQYALVQHRRKLLEKLHRTSKITADEKYLYAAHGKHEPDPLLHLDSEE